MAVTRIKNNQITDNTITFAKIASGTLVGSNFNANLTLNSNVSIIGNLTVTGSTSTVSSTNTYVNDPLVVFNNGYTGSLTGYDIGILVNRNLASLTGYGSVNTAWVWVEADGAFEALTTTDTGGGITSINNSGFANVKVGNLISVSQSVTAATTSTTSGTGALVVTGGAGIGGNVISGGQVNATNGFYSTSTFNGGYSDGIVMDYTNGTGRISVGTADGIKFYNGGPNTTELLVLASSGNVVIPATTTSTTTTTGALVVAGGTGIAGTLNVGGATAITGSLGVTGATTFTTASGGGLQALAIGNVTPGTAAFTTVTASGITQITNATNSSSSSTGALQVTGGVGIGGNLNVAGNLSVNGTLTYLNTTTTTISGTEIVAGVITANSNVASTNMDNGALVVNGGAGIDGNLNIGGLSNFTGNATFSNVTVTGNLTAAFGTVSTNNGQFFGNAAGFGALYAGVVGFTPQAQTTVQVTSNFNGYSQLNMQNINSGSLASSDFIITADNGTANDTYIDVGMASSTYSYPGFGLIHPNDGYMLVYGNATTGGGNLLIGTNLANDIVFSTNGFDHPNEFGRITDANTFVIRSTVNAVAAPSTGALQIAGGQSTLGNVYFGNAAIINGSKTAGSDFYVRGKNDNTLIWARPSATYDAVIIGNSAVQANVVTGAKLQVFTTDSILLPAGTNAQRPGSSGGTDTAGMFRYNTTLNGLEYYGGSTPGWQSLTSNFTVIADQQANGDGTTVAFTLSESQTTNSCIVSINGVIQIPTLAYSVSGTTLTFTEAPAAGDVIDIRKLTTTSTVTNLSSQNGYDVVAVDNTAGIQFYSGLAAQTLQYTLEPTGAWVTQRANVAVASANTETAIDSFAKATYRSAKYVIQATAAGMYQTMEALVIHDDTTPQIVTYGIVQTNGNVGILTSTISGGTVSVNFIAANASTNVRVRKEYTLI
jgi:hypothetical protein